MTRMIIIIIISEILPGVAIREHAKALLHIDRWFLHERP